LHIYKILLNKVIKVNIGKLIFSRSNCVIRTVYTHGQSSTSLLFHMQQPGQKKKLTKLI